MIRYSLACDEGHRFESWFSDSEAFDNQAARSLVVCPTCHSTRVAKTIMAPSVVGKRATDAPAATPAQDTPAQDSAAQDSAAQDSAAKDATMDVALVDPRRRELAALVKSVRDKVIAEGHDVGTRFSDEARRIHDGRAPARQIYGQASIAEAHDLLDEGIMVLPLPCLPDDLN